MAGNRIFRTAIFGGYNKDDVEEYIGTLERELESVKVAHQKEKNELIRELDEQKNDGIQGDEGELKELKELAEKLRAENASLRSQNEEQQTEESGKLLKPEEETKLMEAIITLQEEKNALQEEKDALQEEKRVLEERAAHAEEEAEKLKAEHSGDYFDYETLNKLMEDARKAAAAIEEKSRIKAEQMIEEAKAETEKQKDIIVKKINAQLEEKGIQLIAAKYKIEQYAKELDSVQQNLYSLNLRVNKLTDDMPVRLDDYWEGEYYRSLGNEMQQSGEGSQEISQKEISQLEDKSKEE